MATKLAKMGSFNGMHTAGIYSDMTVDGPEIGTLVVIVDRAKNLPNRKTMGKQDPYCAARLGKEAKKTETDKRGGQTPRWDQELRFTVHESPDYHNLKVSVFNDDKKTELIGETWVSLDNVVVPGGGQSDTWHNLNCKGKYAGEIRIELTYYDSRPKAEKAVVEKSKGSTSNGVEDTRNASIAGPRHNTPVKRRPLPSDPTTSTPSPSIVPDFARAIPVPASGPRSYHTPPPTQHGYRPGRSSDHTPVHNRQNHYSEHHPQPVESRRPLPEVNSPYCRTNSDGNGLPPSQGTQVQPMQSSQLYPYNYDLDHQLSNSLPEPHIDALAWNGPDPSPQYSQKPYAVQPIEPLPQDPLRHGHRKSLQHSTGHGYDYGEHAVLSRPSLPVELPHSNSAPVLPSHQLIHEPRYDRRSEHQALHDGAPYDRSQYREPFDSHYDPAVATGNDGFDDYLGAHHGNTYGQPLPHDGYRAAPPQLEASCRTPASAMQPTVEDEDALPPPPPVHRSSAPAGVPLATNRSTDYSINLAPAPLNISAARDVRPRSLQQGPMQDCQQRSEYQTSAAAHGRHRYSASSVSPHTPYASRPRPGSCDATMPPQLQGELYDIPSSLMPGYSPSSSQDPSRRRYEHRMSTGNQPLEQSPSSWQHGTAPPPAPQPPSNYETPPRPHSLSQPEMSASNSRYSVNMSPVPIPQDTAPLIKPQAVSPGAIPHPTDIRHSRMLNRNIPTRKSVSPQPALEPRRQPSTTPFSPDSFDAFNPAARAAGDTHKSHNSRTSPTPYPSSPAAGGDGNRSRESPYLPKDDGPIVGFHGNVIDPSDHLPVDSWAPEPERKTPQKAAPMRERDRLTGPRDTIVATVSPAGSAGRNRLQKQQRGSVGSAAIGGGGGGNSPLPLRERASYGNSSPSATAAGPLGGWHSGPRGSYTATAPPPIPAKVPLGDGFGSEDLAALSEEMKRIDIGVAAGGGARTKGRWGRSR